MPNVQQTLDQLRTTLATIRSPGQPPPAPDVIGSVGAPPHLAPGARVVDYITGLEGEVIAYGRAGTIHPPARGEGR